MLIDSQVLVVILKNGCGYKKGELRYLDQKDATTLVLNKRAIFCYTPVEHFKDITYENFCKNECPGNAKLDDYKNKHGE